MGASILYAAAVIGIVGILAGILLGVASEKFKVKVDEKEIKVREALPGNNCGGCGYPGCDGLAAAIAKGEAKPDACPVRWASMVPAWILKVSSTMATIGATVVKVRTMPSSSRITLCGLEKKVLTLLSTIVDLLARRVVGRLMASSSFLRFEGRMMGYVFAKAPLDAHPGAPVRCWLTDQPAEYLLSISIQLPTVNATSAQYSGSSSTSLPLVVHHS